MKMLGLTGLTGLSALLVLAGCGSDDPGRGAPITVDAGARGIQVDAGHADAGTMDGRMDSDAGSSMSGDTCPPQMIPPPEGMACAAETLTCLMGAGNAEEQQACLMADADPNGCNGCINGEIFSCATNNGCDDEAGLFQCCIVDNCNGLSGAMLEQCIQMSCAAEFNTFAECANGTVMARSCGVTNLCFQAAMLNVEGFEERALELELPMSIDPSLVTLSDLYVGQFLDLR